MRTVLVTACLMIGFLSVGQGLALIPSTAIPEPGSEVSFQVSGAPAGAQFKWDFNGDGHPDATTNQPWANWTVPAGAWNVTVDVIQGGRSLSQLGVRVVADSRLGAIGEVRWTGGVAEVTVIIRARTEIFGPGLTVDVPPGWTATSLDPARMNEQGQLEILASSATILYPGQELILQYVLYPPSAGARARLACSVTGIVTVGDHKERVSVPVAGPLTF